MRISFNRKANKPLVAVLVLALFAVTALYFAVSVPTASYSKAQAYNQVSEAGATAEKAPQADAQAGAPEMLAARANATPVVVAAEKKAAEATEAPKATPAPTQALAKPPAVQASEQKGLLSNQFTYVLAGAVIAIALLLNLFKVSFAPQMAYDAAIFKTLSSDTRMELLASLQERRKTLSELAAEREISLPGAKQHLELLEEAGLIKKIDEGRKWKYYELTPQGKTILAERYS